MLIFVFITDLTIFNILSYLTSMPLNWFKSRRITQSHLNLVLFYAAIVLMTYFRKAVSVHFGNMFSRWPVHSVNKFDTLAKHIYNMT